MLSRRDFVTTSLRGASVCSRWRCRRVPGFLAQRRHGRAAPLQDGRVLVVIELSGGNDGINTVVPYKDEGYAKSRNALRLSADKLHKVNDAVGLHPSLTGAAKLLERGELAIVQGVGYPNPSRSHFRSMAIWQTARRDPEEHGGPGWLGRAFDERLEAGDASGTTFVGTGQPPAALIGRRSIPATLERLGDLAIKGGPVARGVIGEAPEGDDVGAFVRRTGARRLRRRRQRGRDDPCRKSGGWGIGHRPPRTAVAHRPALEVRRPGARLLHPARQLRHAHAGQRQTHASLKPRVIRGALEISGQPGCVRPGGPRAGPVFQRVRAASARERLGRDGPRHGRARPPRRQAFAGRPGR